MSSSLGLDTDADLLAAEPGVPRPSRLGVATSLMGEPPDALDSLLWLDEPPLLLLTVAVCAGLAGFEAAVGDARELLAPDPGCCCCCFLGLWLYWGVNWPAATDLLLPPPLPLLLYWYCCLRR